MFHIVTITICFVTFFVSIVCAFFLALSRVICLFSDLFVFVELLIRFILFPFRLYAYYLLKLQIIKLF